MFLSTVHLEGAFLKFLLCHRNEQIFKVNNYKISSKQKKERNKKGFKTVVLSHRKPLTG